MFVEDDSGAPSWLAEKFGPVYDSGVPAMRKRIEELERELNYAKRFAIAAFATLQAEAPEAAVDLLRRLA